MKTTALISALGLTLFAAGCTTTTTETTPATVFSKYPAANKINLNIGLVLTPEYQSTKWEFHHAGATVLFPIGDNLATNSEYMARVLFDSVQVLDAPVKPTGGNINAFLIPQVKSFEGSSGTFAWSELVRSLVVVWTLKDLQDNVIWVDTIRADASGHLGTAFSQKSNDERITGEAIDQLFLKSFQAISSASEIQKFVNSK